MKFDSKDLAAIHAAGVRTELPYAQQDPEILELKATFRRWATCCITWSLSRALMAHMKSALGVVAGPASAC